MRLACRRESELRDGAGWLCASVGAVLAGASLLNGYWPDEESRLKIILPCTRCIDALAGCDGGEVARFQKRFAVEGCEIGASGPALMQENVL